MSDLFILNEKNEPILENDMTKWGDWMMKNGGRKIIGKTVIGEIFVSTVFLGLEHGWNGETHVLWETMIFGGEHDENQERYTTHKQAIVGHERAVKLVLGVK